MHHCGRVPLPGHPSLLGTMITEALIARCIRHESRAQYELYRALHPVMMSICSRYERNPDDARARMNEAFLKVLTRLEQRRPGVPFEPWARRIVINTVIDAFRMEHRRRSVETTDATLTGAEPGCSANGFLEEMEAEAFAELLQRVPPMSRNVFNLFAVDGYAHAEIAALLGISEGTSKWHVANARAILQKALAARAGVHERPLAS